MKTWLLKTVDGQQVVTASTFTMGDAFISFSDQDGTVFAIATSQVISIRAERPGDPQRRAA